MWSRERVNVNTYNVQLVVIIKLVELFSSTTSTYNLPRTVNTFLSYGLGQGAVIVTQIIKPLLMYIIWCNNKNTVYDTCLKLVTDNHHRSKCFTTSHLKEQSYFILVLELFTSSNLMIKKCNLILFLDFFFNHSFDCFRFSWYFSRLYRYRIFLSQVKQLISFGKFFSRMFNCFPTWTTLKCWNPDIKQVAPAFLVFIDPAIVSVSTEYTMITHLFLHKWLSPITIIFSDKNSSSNFFICILFFILMITINIIIITISVFIFSRRLFSQPA